MSILGSARGSGGKAPVRAWLYGAPDSGKTHFAKQFPKPILLSTDGNYIYEKIPANSLNAWEVGPLAKDSEKAGAFVNLLELLKQSNQFETVILDLVDGALRLARNHYLKQLKIVHESDSSWGKAYKVIDENFISFIEQLFKLPLNIIIISHQDVEKIEPKNAAAYSVFKPSLADKYHSTIEGYCNLVARVYKDLSPEGVEVRKLALSPRDHEYGINRLGSTPDLVLEHNGDNYGDFMTIWQELFDRRGLGEATVVKTNITRVQAEEDKKVAEKEAKLREAKEAEEKAKAAIEAKQKADAEKVVVEDTKGDEVVVTDSAADKLAKMKALAEAKKLAAEKAADKPVVEDVAPTTVDAVGDGEPPIQYTDAAKEKLARIAQLKAAKLAAQNK